MSLWIIKGSDFVDALKRAFQEHDQANLDYLMAEFSIADHGVTKRQKIKFLDGSWSHEAPKTPTGNGRRPVSKGGKKTLTLIRTRKPNHHMKTLPADLPLGAHGSFDPCSS